MATGVEMLGVSAVGVIGAGQMGAGIAQVAASYGARVLLIDLQTSQLARARENIATSLQKLEAKASLPPGQTASAIHQRITFVDRLDSLRDADLVIEAVVENETIKAELIKNLDKIVRKDCILASNTSSIPITRLASCSQFPGRVIGMHFMNPVPLMKLVEIIPGMGTEAQVVERIRAVCKAWDKETSLSQDYPGFVVNRILMPMLNEAFAALMEGVASAEDIDKGMKLGTNQPMGPLALADFIGLDTCLAIMEVLHQGLGDPRYRPSPLLRKYVEAGYLGRKSKRGVYRYDK